MLCATLQGGDLDVKITEFKKKGKSFEEKTVMDWIVQLTMALQYMHSRRVLHRDLKTRCVSVCIVLYYIVLIGAFISIFSNQLKALQGSKL